MSLKAKIEAIIYAAEEPITVEQISSLVKDLVLAEQAQAAALAAQPEQSSDYVHPDAAATEAAQEAASAESAEAAPAEGEPAESAAAATAKKAKKELSEDAKIRAYVRKVIEELVADYEKADRGMEVRAVAGGYRMSTRAEHHDVVRAFAKSLKPPVRLSLAALETLAVIAYKQPVTVPEISEIRGVEASGVIGTLLDRKLITTAGRKQVVGRPILYKTSKDFLMRFGLNDVNELPSMEEFEKLASDGQGDLFSGEASAPLVPAGTVIEQSMPVGDEVEEESLESDAAEVAHKEANGKS